jgi:hypothetical protein
MPSRQHDMLLQLFSNLPGLAPLSAASAEELDIIGERLLTASSPKEVLGSLWYDP